MRPLFGATLLLLVHIQFTSGEEPKDISNGVLHKSDHEV